MMSTAADIARAGGTAWQAYSGLWCYITDSNDRHVYDFLPNSFQVLYQPLTPLAESDTGGFQWKTVRP